MTAFVDPAPLSAIFLGFLLGLQHATDPDHLVAVATILTRERRFADGALIGVLWGAGHMTTLTIVGAIIIGLKLTITPAVGDGLELIVAAMLIVLGIFRLRDAVRGLETVPAGHLVADHDHGGGTGVVHSHPHVHDAAPTHEHPHVHPSRWLSALGWRSGWPAGRALVVGAVHGLAGSAAVSLLVLATLRTTASAVVYLLIFGVGTIIGMTLLTAVMAYPVSLALRYRRARQALALCAGLGSIAFGLFYGYGVI
ncbi:MAG: high-affinity nickel-transport family protein [Candidatus Rokuibacteriota bacterium]